MAGVGDVGFHENTRHFLYIFRVCCSMVRSVFITGLGVSGLPAFGSFFIMTLEIGPAPLTTAVSLLGLSILGITVATILETVGIVANGFEEDSSD